MRDQMGEEWLATLSIPGSGSGGGWHGPAHQLHVGQLLSQHVGVAADAKKLPVDGGWRLGPVGDGLVGAQQVSWSLAQSCQLLVQGLQKLMHPLSVCLEWGRWCSGWETRLRIAMSETGRLPS